jgi:hypothetical protein
LGFCHTRASPTTAGEEKTCMHEQKEYMLTREDDALLLAFNAETRATP